MQRQSYGFSTSKFEDALEYLGGVDEHVFEHVIAIVVIAIGLFLTLDAESSPRYRSQAFRTDLLLAVEADAERTFFQATKRRSHIAEQMRLAVQVADCELAFGSVLHFIQRIGALLDSYCITVANDAL